MANVVEPWGLFSWRGAYALLLELRRRFGPLEYLGRGCSRAAYRTACGRWVVKVPTEDPRCLENIREHARSGPLPDGSVVAPTRLLLIRPRVAQARRRRAPVPVLVMPYLLPLSTRGQNGPHEQSASQVWRDANPELDGYYGHPHYRRNPFGWWREEELLRLGYDLSDGDQFGLSLGDGGRLYRYDVGEPWDGPRVNTRRVLAAALREAA